MNINLLTSQYKTNNVKPTFKGYDFFYEVKKMPKMTCALCGKPTIPIDSYVKAIAPLSKPLEVQIKKGIFNYLEQRFPVIYEKLVSLSEQFPHKSLDEIIEENDNTYKDLKQTVVKTWDETYTQPQGMIERDRKINNVFFDIIENSRAHMRSASVVIKGLSPFKEYLSGIRREVFEQLEIYSRKYPRKTISEIVNLPEIKKFHEIKNLLQRTETREKLDYHFDNIRLLVKKKNPKAVETFDNLKEVTLEMFTTEKDGKIREYKAEMLYRNALEENGCQKITDAVINELRQVPKTFLTKDSFFNYIANANYYDGKIISALFTWLFATEEHVEAVSRGGYDTVNNKIIMHKECNNFRASIPYRLFLKYHPEMKENIQKQINMISKGIINDELPDNLRLYPIRIAENLYKITNGELDIDITEYCEKELIASRERVDKTSNQINILHENKSKIEKEIDSIKESNDKEKKLQYKLKEYLEKH